MQWSTIDGVALGWYAVKKIPVRDDLVRTRYQWVEGGRECSGVRYMESHLDGMQ
jgi:hypothetical protein